MLRKLTLSNFKSLERTQVEFPRLTVLFGPNAAGKSNLLEAVLALSRIGTSRTISDAMSDPIRGYPFEAFRFPENGLPGLVKAGAGQFAIESELDVIKERYRYKIGIEIQMGSGALTVKDEYLAALNQNGIPKGKPSIERVEDKLRIRRKSKPAHPREEPVGLNHAILSDPRLAETEYLAIERVRNELSGWRVYYLDPRVAMRLPRPPADVRDIGVLGGDIAPFLYRLRDEKPKLFEAVSRTLRSLIPSVENVAVDLDSRRGTLDIVVKQDGTEFSSRVISEGTLRVLALCAIVVNPWSGSLLAFEEPENGVHPKRIELIAQLLASLAVEGKRQVIVTTHSPLFCQAILRQSDPNEIGIALLNVYRAQNITKVKVYDRKHPLFQDAELADALTTGDEDGVFEGLVLRGMFDG